jgi:hypothetical protein
LFDCELVEKRVENCEISLLFYTPSPLLLGPKTYRPVSSIGRGKAWDPPQDLPSAVPGTNLADNSELRAHPTATIDLNNFGKV